LTSSSKSSAALTAIVLALLPFALGAGNIEKRGPVTVARWAEVGDVVVADGALHVHGKANGSVFVVKGNVVLSSGSVVKGNITVLGGDLLARRGCLVEGEINVFSGRANVEPGARTMSEVRALEEVSSLTPEKLDVISRYIIFDRPLPPDAFKPADLAGLDLGEMDFRRVRSQRVSRLGLFDLGRARLDREQVEDAYEVVFRNHRLGARVAMVRFKSEDAVEKFWEKFRTSREKRTNYSVHNSLGDGAHWFFRHEGTSFCMWRKGPTLMALMVRHNDDDPEEDEWIAVEEARDSALSLLRELLRNPGENRRDLGPKREGGRDENYRMDVNFHYRAGDVNSFYR